MEFVIALRNCVPFIRFYSLFLFVGIQVALINILVFYIYISIYTSAIRIYIYN